MRVIGLLAFHSTELGDDVPIIEVGRFGCARISILATDPEMRFCVKSLFLFFCLKNSFNGSQLFHTAQL